MDRRAHVNRNLQFSITLCDTTFYLTETESKNNPRFLYSAPVLPSCQHIAYENSVQQSMQGWLYVWKFLHCADHTRERGVVTGEGNHQAGGLQPEREGIRWSVDATAMPTTPHA